MLIGVFVLSDRCKMWYNSALQTKNNGSGGAINTNLSLPKFMLKGAMNMDTPIVKQATIFGESEDVSFQPYKGYRFALSVKQESYCSCCKQMKSTDEFSPSKVSTNGFHWYCRKCVKDKDEPYKQARTEAGWQRRYGISADEYQALFDRQKGVCAICGKPEARIHKGTLARLSVDHNHVTGEVRGLLCQSCNYGIGQFKDDPGLLSNAIDYLMNE